MCDLVCILGNTSVVTVTDPVTGQPVQQVVQTVTDPKTGETKQVVVPQPQTQTQVVTVPDPVTGQPVQQLVQTDPFTGQTTMIPVSDTNGTLLLTNLCVAVMS